MKSIDIEVAVETAQRLRHIEALLGFSEADRTAIKESGAILSARLPAILDELRDRLLVHEETRALFLEGGGASEHGAELFDEWFLTALEIDDPSGLADFVVRLAKLPVGENTALWRLLPPRHAFGIASHAQTAVHTALEAALPDDLARANRLARAWNKLILIQLELFLKVVAPQWGSWDER